MIGRQIGRTGLSCYRIIEGLNGWRGLGMKALFTSPQPDGVLPRDGTKLLAKLQRIFVLLPAGRKICGVGTTRNWMRARKVLSPPLRKLCVALSLRKPSRRERPAVRFKGPVGAHEFF